MNIDKDLENVEKELKDRINGVIEVVKGLPLSKAKQVLDIAMEEMAGTAIVTLN